LHQHKLPVLLFTLLALSLFVTTPALAQKGKKVTKPATKGIKPRLESAEPVPPPINLAAEAALVAEQIKLITRFTFVYGKVMNSLEMAAEEEKKGRASAAVIEQTRKGREALVANIADLALGLDKVVARLQANPRLQVQYLKVSYAVEPLSNARQNAAAGQLNEAGKWLVLSVERLTDALLALR
jgi:hypothetical protein